MNPWILVGLLFIAAAGMAVIGILLAAVMREGHRPTTYTTDHAAAGPLLDRTEAIL